MILNDPVRIMNPYLLKQKTAQLASLTVLTCAVDYEDYAEDLKDSIKQLLYDLATDIRAMSSEQSKN